MGFIKKASGEVHGFEHETKHDIAALNVPSGNGWDVFSDEFKKPLEKSAKLYKGEIDLNGFDIEAEINKNPDFLYTKVLAIKKNEVNENGDAFPEEELKKSAHTFIGVPVFCNHQNDNIENARGKVVHAWYDEEVGGIYTINMVDSIAYPSLARGIEEGYIIGTSMGCSVEASVCSVCLNVAETPDHYCTHVRNQKNRTFSGKVKNAYGENGVTLKGYDKCPIKVATDSDGNIVHESQKVYEHNFGIRFIEDSFVVNPACPECLVQEVLNTGTIQQKVASAVEVFGNFKKVASCSTGACNLKKYAGKDELNELTAAMDKLEKVAKSMMAQKEHVSMEYVSDLVKSLSDIQSVTDELIDNGYAQLPSPDIQSINNANVSTLEGSETSVESGVTPEQQQKQTAPPQPTSFESGGLEQGIGSVTKPKFAENEKKIKDFSTESRKQREAGLSANNAENKTLTTQSEMESQKMAEKQGNTEGEQVKEAAYGVEGHQSTDHITEKQLAEKSGDDYAGSRDVYSPEVIVEKQLSDTPDVNRTTTETPLKRTEAYEVITEKQLETIQSGCICRWDQLPDVITEKQWTDISRAVGAQLNTDQSEHITEKQLGDFLSHHRYILPEVITEKQFEDQPMTLERWAFQDNIDRLIKSAMESVADTIRNYGKTPNELKKAIATISAEKDKATAGVLVNAAPYKKESLASESERFNYFGIKTASQISPVDALMLSMAGNLEDMSASDLIDTVASVLDNDKSFKKAEELSKQKKESKKEETTLSKKAQIEKALEVLDRDPDGEYEFVFPLSEVSASTDNKEQFVKQARALAFAGVRGEIGDDVDLSLLKIETDDNDMAFAFVKETSKLTEDEKVALASLNNSLNKEAAKEGKITKTASSEKEVRAAKREKMLREAQLFGGEMGGQAGASQAPGAGMGAAAPGADGMGMGMGSPVESFEDSPMEEQDASMEDDDKMPKPPGAVCPVCGSEDVDIVDGKGKCNNCGAEFNYKVLLEITKYPGLIEESEDGEDKEEDFAGEGVELPEEAPTMGPGMDAGMGGGMPAAAASEEGIKFTKFATTVKITPEIAKKAGKAPASVSPITGSTNTVRVAGNALEGTMLCKDTNITYDYEILADSKDPKNIYAQLSWNPVSPLTSAGCDSCSRSKKAFASVLKKAGIETEAFESMDWSEKAKVVIDLKEKNLLETVKTASAQESIVESIVKTAQVQSEDKFPTEECMEKIARRYGENALALSGPCEGKPLAECVCERMKTAGINSTIAVMKVADIWSEKDGCEECKEDRIREGFTMKQAEFACDKLRDLYAQFDDNLADEVAIIEIEEGPMGPDNDPSDDTDPFDDDKSGEEVTDALVTLVKNLGKVEEVDRALDAELGDSAEEIAAEEHHDADEVAEDILADGELDGETLVEETPESPEVGAAEIVDEVIEDKSMEGCCDPEEKEMMDAPEEEKAMECGEKDALDPVGEEDDDIDNDGDVDDSDEYLGNRREKIEENMEEKEGNSEDDDNKEDTTDSIPGVHDLENEEGRVEKVGEEDEDEQEMKMYQEASNLRRGRVGKVGEVNLDLSTVMAALQKQAGKVSVETAQDAAKDAGAADWKNSSMGAEESFSADSPKVPSGDATIKHEKDNKELTKEEHADVHTGDAKMGEEELDSELTDKATGGTDGQGKSASTKDRLTALAENILKIKEANESKVEVKQNQDDEDTKPHSAGDSSMMGGEKDSIGSVPKAEKYPEGTAKDADQFLGNEKDSIGDRPTEKDTPDVPTADARMGHEKDNDKIKSEKTDEMQGISSNNSSVTASGSSEPKVAGSEKATKVAGKLLQAGKIQVGDLPAKIAELSGFTTEALEAIETLALAPQPGLPSGPDGFEKAIVMEKTASVNEQQEPGLKEQIMGMFKLHTQSEEAALTNEDLFRKFK